MDTLSAKYVENAWEKRNVSQTKLTEKSESEVTDSPSESESSCEDETSDGASDDASLASSDGSSGPDSQVESVSSVKGKLVKNIAKGKLGQKKNSRPLRKCAMRAGLGGRVVGPAKNPPIVSAIGGEAGGPAGRTRSKKINHSPGASGETHVNIDKSRI